MRVLWSRVLQIPGTCRCNLCVSNATAITRHRGPSGLRSSWTFRTPTSTFLYTSIFAAGLTIDARAKSKRNRQWEEAFAQLRDALDGRSDTAASRERAQEPDDVSSPHGLPRAQESDGDVVRRAARTEVEEHLAVHEQEVPQLGDAVQTWDDIRFDSRMPGAQALAWPANTGRDLVPHNLPPQSLWAPDTLRWTALRRRHTQKKLAMQGLSTGLLVHTLIRKVNLGRYLNSARQDLANLSPVVRDVASFSDDEAKTARTNLLLCIEQLHLTSVDDAEEIASQRDHAAHHGIPSYVQDADGDFYAISKQMNKGITQLFRQCGKSDDRGEATGKRNDRDEAIAIAKICHNLLVSTAAPDLQTFNILISGFTQWRRHNLVDDVITAFDTCKIRPNELACKQILGFYAAQSRPDDFSRFVAKMRGVGDALSLANPAITVNEASQGRLVRINEDKVYQKVHPTPMVFAALVDGVLQFAGFDRALDVYYEMKADGWGLAISGLTRLLADCIRRADWEGGTYIWEEINLVKTKAKRSSAASAYHHMLSLCSVTGNTVAFNQVLNEVAKRGFDQKAIIREAMKTTRWAQHKRDNMAPAWAADNLMIAVSGYLDDANPSNEMSGDLLPDEVEDGDETFTQTQGATTVDQRAEPGIRFLAKDDVADSKEAWSSWVEHEFGEKPKDPEP